MLVRESGSRAKKPRIAKLQQPACTHRKHQILSTAEANAFAAQFLDRKVYPTKASQQEFLATCIDVDMYLSISRAMFGGIFALRATFRLCSPRRAPKHTPWKRP